MDNTCSERDCDETKIGFFYCEEHRTPGNNASESTANEEDDDD
jgi:hypothetical protein